MSKLSEDLLIRHQQGYQIKDQFGSQKWSTAILAYLCFWVFYLIPVIPEERPGFRTAMSAWKNPD